MFEDLSDMLRKNPSGTEKLSISTNKRRISMSDVDTSSKRKNQRQEPDCGVTSSSSVTVDSVVTCATSSDSASLRLTKSDTDVFPNSSDEKLPSSMLASNTHVLLTFELSYDKKHDQILFGDGLGKC